MPPENRPSVNSATGLAGTLPAGSLLGLEARVDSALLWALIRHRLELGLGAAHALADTVAVLRAAGASGRFNFLLTDGRVIAATAASDTLWYRASGHAVVVASEPGDDEPGWIEVPDGSVVTATPRQVSVAPLAAAGNPAPRVSPAPPVSPDQNTEDGRIAIR